MGELPADGIGGEASDPTPVPIGQPAAAARPEWGALRQTKGSPSPPDVVVTNEVGGRFHFLGAGRRLSLTYGAWRTFSQEG
jgi:hypothetical protein